MVVQAPTPAETEATNRHINDVILNSSNTEPPSYNKLPGSSREKF